MFEKTKKKLTRRTQVLQLTHAYCADGTGCAVVLENCPITLTTMPVKYDEIDNVLQETDFDAYDVVLITDISPKKKSSLDLSDKIILLDHHETALKYNNPEKLKFVTQNFCGTVLVTDFAEKVWDIDLSHLYEFMELTNDYDMWYKDDDRSSEMNMLYYHMWHDKYLKRFIDGDVKFTADEKKFIRNRKKEIKEHFEKLDVIEVGMNDGCFISTQMFVNEMCNGLMEEEGYKLVFSYNAKNGNCSIRNDYDEVNIGEILESLDLGGGHSGAGGMTERDTDILKKNITKVVEVVKKIIGED